MRTRSSLFPGWGIPEFAMTATLMLIAAVAHAGPFFFSTGPAATMALRGLRLSYSALQPSEIARGVQLLGTALTSMLDVARSPDSVVY